MANIDPQPSWANIRRLETTDRNMAGPGGILNDPTTSIAARLNLLRDNDTTLGNSVAAVNARQDAADTAIANIQGQVLNAPGTLSDLDNGTALDPVAGFPDVPSVENTLGPVNAINQSIESLAARTKKLSDWRVEDLAALSANSGSGLIGFDQGTASSVPWDLLSKLRTEVRNVMDFIPQNQKSGILNGTSTWDASTAINRAIVELGGGEIIVPKGARLAISAPIDIQRGTYLRGAGTFDTMPGVGCKIFLLPGSNCPMLRTPLAAGTGVATHFMGVENLLFDGNKANQTAESIAMQFYGAFVGSWLRNVCMLNTLGPSLVMQGGTDVDVSHLWIVGATVADGYALDTNLDLSGSALSGLLQMDNVYIENTGIDKTIDPKTNPESRGKNARLRRLASAYIASLHTEGAVNALDIDQCHTVRIGKITGANIGNLTASDAAVVRFLNANTRAVSIGTMFLGQVTGTPALIRKATGVTNNYLQDVPYTTNPYVVGYEAQNDRLNGSKRQVQTSFANQAFATKNGGFSTIGFYLFQADPDNAASARSGLTDAGTGPKLSSSIGQSGNAIKDFLSVISTGNALDRITVSDPFLVGSRTTAADIPAGCMYRMTASTVGGAALVYQRTSGANSSADTIVTAQRGAAAPTVNADYLGQVFLDLSSSRRAYIAVNTGTGALDWKPITS